MIGLGNNMITALALGNNSVSAVYLGDNKIWPVGTSYRIINPTAEYSSGNSLNPDKSNYVTFTGTLEKYVGNILESSTEVDLTPSVLDDKVVVSDGEIYWNKDGYGNQITEVTSVSVGLSYSMKDYEWSGSATVDLAANTVSMTGIEFPFFYLTEGNKVLSTVKVHYVGGTYGYSISVKRTFTYLSGYSYQTTSRTFDGLELTYPMWVSYTDDSFIVSPLLSTLDRTFKITVTDTTFSKSISVTLTQIYEKLDNLVVTYSSDSMLLPDKSNYLIVECDYNGETVKLRDVVVNHSTLSDVIVPLNDAVYNYRFYFNKDAYNAVDMSSYGEVITLDITGSLYGLKIAGSIQVKANKVESSSVANYKLNCSLNRNYFPYTGGTLIATPSSTGTRHSKWSTGAETTEDIDVTTYFYYPTSSSLYGSGVDTPVSIQIAANNKSYPILGHIWLRWRDSTTVSEYATKDYFVKSNSSTSSMQLWNSETNTRILANSTVSADSEITLIDNNYDGSQVYDMQDRESKLSLTAVGGILTISGIPSSEWTGELSITDGDTELTFNITSA